MPSAQAIKIDSIHANGEKLATEMAVMRRTLEAKIDQLTELVRAQATRQQPLVARRRQWMPRAHAAGAIGRAADAALEPEEPAARRLRVDWIDQQPADVVVQEEELEVVRDEPAAPLPREARIDDLRAPVAQEEEDAPQEPAFPDSPRHILKAERSRPEPISQEIAETVDELPMESARFEHPMFDMPAPQFEQEDDGQAGDAREAAEQLQMEVDQEHDEGAKNELLVEFADGLAKSKLFRRAGIAVQEAEATKEVLEGREAVAAVDGEAASGAAMDNETQSTVAARSNAKFHCSPRLATKRRQSPEAEKEDEKMFKAPKYRRGCQLGTSRFVPEMKNIIDFFCLFIIVIYFALSSIILF